MGERDTGLCSEVFAIPVGEEYLLYAPLNGLAMVCNHAMVDLVQKASAGARADADGALAQLRGILAESGVSLAASPLEVRASGRGPIEPAEFSPTRVTLLVTTNCNLRCVYCYASAGDAESRTIPFGICQAAIDLIVGNAARLGVPDIHVAFHGGGEPTTAFGLIQQCSDYGRAAAAAHGLQASFSLVTNGVLTDAQVDWLADNMYGISISLDGPADVQDLQRPMRSGRGSCEHVLRTIERFEARGIDPFLRATITNHTADRMGEISRFFCEHFATTQFQLEPVSGCGRCGETGVCEPSIEQFLAGAEEAAAEAARFGKKAVCSVALEAFPDVIESYCGVAAPNFVVTPEGEVTACYEVGAADDPRSAFFFYGRYDRSVDRFIFNEETIRRLRGHVVQSFERCADCFARWQCAGDCPVRSSLRYPAPENDTADFRCEVTRGLLLQRLLDVVAATPCSDV